MESEIEIIEQDTTIKSESTIISQDSFKSNTQIPKINEQTKDLTIDINKHNTIFSHQVSKKINHHSEYYLLHIVCN